MNTPEEQETLRQFFAEIKKIEGENAVAVTAGLDALPRLVKAAYGHDNSQAQIIALWLASIYNSSCARPVELDSIRRLDWALQKDLAAVLISVGHIGFSDEKIRQECEAQFGKPGVDWLHWYTTGGPHTAALTRLTEFIRANSRSSSAGALLAMLRSIASAGPADLSRLNFIDDEHTRDFVLVLDGLFGRDQGMLHIEDVSAAVEGLRSINV